MDFSGYQYPSDIILQAVRYYVSYKLSTRDIDHSTVNRQGYYFCTDARVERLHQKHRDE